MVLSDGGTGATLGVPFTIFQNEIFSFCIHGVPDKIHGVNQRGGKTGWMESDELSEWLDEKRLLSLQLNSIKRIRLVDIFSGFKLTGKAKETQKRLNTELKSLPKMRHIFL